MSGRAAACLLVALCGAAIGCDPARGADPTPPTTPAAAARGADFTRAARTLSCVVACGGHCEVPRRLSRGVVNRHCQELRHIYDEYRRTFVEVAEPFLAGLRPRDAPRSVVYPFGGGDLATALATFPDATEITTLSLEPSGDASLIDRLPPAQLGEELSMHRAHLERLYDWGYSRTENLADEASSRLPGEVLFALAALAVHGLEPVGLRYFRLRPDGAMAYVTRDDIARAPDADARRALFDDVELRFRDPRSAGGIRVFRHVAANLDDDHLRTTPILAFLDRRLDASGAVSVMTKAASHRLWDDDFSRLRGWLLAHVAWMASDSTGFPPRLARAAGLVQDAYGIYEGRPWGMTEGEDGADLRRLFGSAPRAELGFHYGYPDVNGHAYLLVTRREGPVGPAR